MLYDIALCKIGRTLFTLSNILLITLVVLQNNVYAFEAFSGAPDTNQISLDSKNQIDDNYHQDDALLMKEIFGISKVMYKNIIDISALYFNGVLFNYDQLYDQIILDLGRNFFQIIKLLAWYSPRMLQNPHLSWKVKAKKSAFIISFIAVFILWSKEIYRQKQRNNHDSRQRWHQNSSRALSFVSQEWRPNRPLPLN